MKKYFFGSTQSGNGLISLIVAMAITAMVMTITMVVREKQGDFKKSMNEDLELSIAKTIIKSKVSCRKSFPEDENEEFECSAGEHLVLKDKQGRDYIKDSGKGLRIGKWNFKAVCNSKGNGVQIRFARLKKSGNIDSKDKSSFRKDSLTGTQKTWDDDKSLLFGENTTICPDTIIMGFRIDKECVVKRSKATKKDFVNWCPEKHPKLYSCLQVDDTAPGIGEDIELQNLSACSGDGPCNAKRYRRKQLGGDAIYYERVEKNVGDKTIDGCWIYDNSHTHTPHKTDIMCCR